MKILAAVIFITILCQACGKSPADVTYFNEGFKGITYTDRMGRNIGPEDRADWNLFVGNGGDELPYLFKSFPIEILPTSFGVGAAFPNPSDSVFHFRFSLPVKGYISIVIVDDQYRSIWDTTIHREAGICEPIWSVHNESDGNLANGIYRAFYQFGNNTGAEVPRLHGYGDLWYIDPELVWPLIQGNR